MDQNLLKQPIAQSDARISGDPAGAGRHPEASGADDLKIPEKFIDPETGELRVEALLKSYLELERKLAGMIELPGEDADDLARAEFRRKLGVPESPEDYAVTPANELIQADPDVNRMLHEAGFTPEQVQLVYDIAAERMLPAIDEISQEFEATHQLERLVEHFGGEEQWSEVADQLSKWGKAHLPPEVFQALSTTFEGVLAMHRMMTGGEPGLLKDAAPAPEQGEEQLRKLMGDPRYWRDRDPAVIQQVTEGFRRLFPDSPRR